MELRNYLRGLSLLLLCLLLTNCSYFRKPEKEIVVQTVEVEKRIPLQNQPKPIDMTDVEFYVVQRIIMKNLKKGFQRQMNHLFFML